jgi:3-oxoacyl-[acyl-carrier-protein] synthase-1
MMPISVFAAGMVTPVGFNSESSGAAIRGGISGVKQVNLWDAENGEFLSAGKVNLPQWWQGIGKLADLVAPAIWECLEAARPEPALRIPLLLGIAPRDRPHRLPRLDEEILDEVEWRLELPRHPESAIIPMGNVSGVIGIQRAQEILRSGLARYCVVAGVDSLLQQDVMNVYLAQRRVVTKSNSNGFFPGEAGCAVLVGSSGERSGAELRLAGLAYGTGEVPVTSEDPNQGKLLTALVREALRQADLNIEDTFYRNTDINGEHYKFKEASFIPSRIQRKPLPYLHELWHPAEFLGEIGAALVPCELGRSFYYGKHRCGPGPLGICHFGNDSGERSAVVVEHRGSD